MNDIRFHADNIEKALGYIKQKLDDTELEKISSELAAIETAVSYLQSMPSQS